MNPRAIRAIIRKDLLVVVRNKGVLIPLVVVPLVIFTLVPGLTALIPMLPEVGPSEVREMEEMLQRMPAGFAAEIADYQGLERIYALMLIYFMAPMYLIIPLMVASVIAADSFAGEKERKTLEALLYTPTSDLELFLAKVLAGWLAAMAVAWVGFLLYAVVANAAAWSVMGRVFFPNLMWVLLVLWVVPAVAALGLGSMVVVSQRAQSFQEAYQLGGVVVLPLMALLIGQALGVMYFSVGLVALLGLALWAVDAALLWMGVRSFGRGELKARL
ncbi:MAG: ABC transporter permease subunit [Chloroflexi bacterium]|nr:ABC transporter permease subunit [Chloroflexota bacterium]